MVSRSSSNNRSAGRGFVARGRTPPDCLSHRQAVDFDIPASAADIRSDAPDARQPLRNRRGHPDVGAPHFIAPARLIDHRPQIANDRSRFGDWKGDLIDTRTRTRSAIGNCS